MLFQVSHVLKLSDSGDHSKREEVEVRIVDAIAAHKHCRKDVYDSAGDKLSIDSMIHVIGSVPGEDTLVLEDTESFIDCETFKKAI
jgi:hypothetical protein